MGGKNQLVSIARLERDGTRAENRYGLSAKRTSPFKSAGVSVQLTTGSRGCVDVLMYCKTFMCLPLRLTVRINAI